MKSLPLTSPLRPAPVLFTLSALCLASAWSPLRAQTISGPITRAQAAPRTVARKAPYNVLDRVEGAWVHTGEVAVRPLCRDPRAGGGIWSVNTHRNTVERFDPLGREAIAIHPTPAAPVALAVWGGTIDDTSDDELLVSCAGSSGLLRLDLDGRLLGFLPLPAGPRDVLVDQERDLAFVACALTDTVVQIDLVQGVIERSYGADDFFAKKPTFLSFAPNGDVLVAPLISGNNTIAERRGTVVAGDRVLDLTDPTIADLAAGGDLPDEDLFRIDPVAETITPVLRGLGTVLFAHGVHPDTGALWMLNTDAINQDPNRQTEPSIQGDFSRNRLTIADLGTVGGPTLVTQFLELDQRDLSSPLCATGDCPIDPERTVGQPYQLTFGPGGEAFVCGLLTDNVMILDSNGAFVAEFNLPDGSIPRGLLLTRENGETLLTVHCFGTSELQTYRRSDLALFRVQKLEPDLSPAILREGRALFYDASKSRDNNTSCATCHVEGESDFLVWNLSAGPSDDKGPMMTQTLAGIERMAPFHWRGERPELSDFNPAFVELLGGEELDEAPGGEFEAFEAFVFSIQNRPNPDQSPYRILDAGLPAPTVSGNGDAVRGQTAFFTEATFGVFTCNDCHQMPLGTNNDDFQDLALENRPKRSRLNVAPFHGMEERADMPRDEVILWNDPGDPLQGTTTSLHAALGAGTSHAGLTADLQTFVDAVGNLGNSDPEMAEDITAFVAQFDTGIAGSAVQARYLDASSSLTERREVANLLVEQARERNCSLAVIGETVSTLPGGPVVTRRWSYDPLANGGEGLFSCEDPAEGTRSFADFLLGLGAGERLLFVGLPVGSSERFAIDADLDGLANAVDPSPEEPWIDPGDQTAPAFERGPEALWKTTQLARILCDTDEPTRLIVRWSSTLEGVLHERSFDDFSKTHSVLISDLLPSTLNGNGTGQFAPLEFAYDVEVTAIDRAGNQVVSTIGAPLVPEHYIDSEATRQDHILSSLVWTLSDSSMTDPNGATRFRGDVLATAAYRMGGPPAVPAAQRVIAARVLVNGIVSETALPIGARTFKTDVLRLRRDGDPIEADLGEPGPFLVTIDTDTNGEAIFRFQQDGLQPGDVVELEISAVVELSDHPDDEAAFFLDGVETTACTAGTSVPDADCDGPNDCCRLDVLIPRLGAQGLPQVHAARRFIQWSFPRTPAHARRVVVTIP